MFAWGAVVPDVGGGGARTDPGPRGLVAVDSPGEEAGVPRAPGRATCSQSPRTKGHSVMPAPPAPPELSRNVPVPACGSVGPCSIRSCLGWQTLVAGLNATPAQKSGGPPWGPVPPPPPPPPPRPPKRLHA